MDIIIQNARLRISVVSMLCFFYIEKPRNLPNTRSTPNIDSGSYKSPTSSNFAVTPPNTMTVQPQSMMIPMMTADGQVVMQPVVQMMTADGQVVMQPVMLNGNQMFPMMMGGYNVGVGVVSEI